MQAYKGPMLLGLFFECILYMTNFNQFINDNINYILFTCIAGTYLLILVFFPAAYIWAVYEDLTGEWAQWFSFLAACLLAFRISMMPSQYRTFFFLLGIASFYVLMEEVSWGQRLLNYASPTFFTEHNLQNETNLHNFFVGPQDTIIRSIIEYGLALALCSYGLLYPLLLKKGLKSATFLSRWIPSPPLSLWPFFVTAGFLELSPFYMLEQELAELLVAVGLLIMCLHYYLRHKQQTLHIQPSTRLISLTASIIILLSFMTTYSVNSIPHMQAQINDRIDYGYRKFSDRYERYQAWGSSAQLKERLLQKKPRDVELIREIATLYQRDGNLQKARHWVSKALLIDLPRFQRYPDWVSVNLSLAKTYALSQADSEVKRHLDHALEGAKKKVARSPDNAKSIYWLGKTYAQRREKQLATQAFKHALKLDPESTRYRNAYVDSLNDKPVE